MEQKKWSKAIYFRLFMYAVIFYDDDHIDNKI